MSTSNDRRRRATDSAALERHGLVLGACIGSMLLALACDPQDGRDGDSSPGNDRLEEIEQAIGPALSQAAAHVRNEANWVEPDGEMPGDGGGSDGGDGGGSDGGGDPGGGASCAGSCGGAASDGSCYCDAECSSNGDCCSDYAQHCGGGDGGDEGGGDGGGGDAGDGGDGGGAAGSCAGACGGVGSDGACYCDSACSGNGDCCSDYAQQCGGGGDGGDGGGDGGGAATCNGYCGGAGSDGSCYCDDACEENGDCCSDFSSWCAVGIAGDPSFELTARVPTLASSDACWGIITDPVDVERIGTAAAIGGVAFGSSCVAVLVVPAGAAAVPSGGVSVGAAALACSTSALGGAAGGALAELASQKMGSLAQCSADIISSVMQIFPWGAGEKKVDVPVFTTTPADPGNCTPDQKDALQQEVNDVCKNAGTRSCSFADSCDAIKTKIDVAAQCIEARQKINSQCYDGGDAGHNQAVQQEVNLQNNCWSISSSVGC